ncbi:MAG: PHP domain-containing protein [Candidatus Dormibacteraeota bacterium]|nr:PHP domain-containing protein [Candidatus Dormibacteraeota bacterium]
MTELSPLERAIRTLAEIGYRLRMASPVQARRGQRGSPELYRARAFAEAAQMLILYRPDLSTEGGRQELRALPGVGERIEQIVFEVAADGSSRYLTRLREEAGVHVDRTTVLDRAAYQGDLHTHTPWSDGRATLADMAEVAAAHHFRCLGVTDHSPFMTIVKGVTPERLAEQRQEIETVGRAHPELTILQGIEVDILEDGSLDLDDETLSRLDLVIASPHVKLRMPREQMTERMLRAVGHPAVSILGHPTGRRPGSRAGADYDTQAVFREAARRGVVIEIDCDPNRVDVGPELAAQALALGCDFALDSDAHAPRDFGYIELGLWVPEAAGVPQDRIVNWLPVDQLRARLRR